ncbi:MAG: hypothetical protein JWO38_1473 [Gemmataceae bacterium]|nr:hypothetical protein [Gemmataceae bacterium]
MPGCGVHLILASRVIAPGTRPAARVAFLVGAVAPDMGYYPGADRFCSDLSHYVRPGRLAEALLRGADCDVSRAFALGWATHVLADTLVHPLINRAAGELGRGRPAPPLTFADDPVAHIRVEQGLDAVIAARFGTPSLWPALGRVPLGFVVHRVESAYLDTYGIAPSRRALWATGRALYRGVGLLLSYGRIVGSLFGEPGTPPETAVPIRIGASALRTVVAPFRRSPAYAFAHPAQPPAWLVDQLAEVIRAFPDRFAALAARGLADLPDANLDTGEVDGAGPYPPAVATVRELGNRGGRV